MGETVPKERPIILICPHGGRNFKRAVRFPVPLPSPAYQYILIEGAGQYLYSIIFKLRRRADWRYPSNGVDNGRQKILELGGLVGAGPVHVLIRSNLQQSRRDPGGQGLHPSSIPQVIQKLLTPAGARGNSPSAP